MSDERPKLDAIDKVILDALQRDGSLSQRELAEQVGLSQNACWRRLQRLVAEGMIEGRRTRLNAGRLGLDLTVFMLVKTRRHSRTWTQEFRHHVEAIPEVAELHRIGGDWDYLLKIVTSSMAGYDRVYRQITEKVELATVTGLFSMETILDDRPLHVRVTR